MIFIASGSYSGIFAVTSNTGAAVNADSLPTATAYHNGVLDAGFTLTVVNETTGIYKVSGTVGAYTVGDSVGIVVNATVGTITTVATIDSGYVDILSNSVGAATTTLVWNALTSGLTTSGSIGKLLAATPTFPTNFSSLVINGSGFITYSNTAPASAASIAALILKTPANLLVTDANGFVTYSNAAPPTGASIAALILSNPANLLLTNVSGYVTASGINGITFPTNFGSLFIHASGYTQSYMTGILSSAITESVTGYLSAGFKEFLNVSTPVFNLNAINPTGDPYARLGAPAGASVSADVAAIKLDTGTNIPTDVTNATSTLTAAVTAAQTAINAHTDTDTSGLSTASALSAAITTLSTAITNAVTSINAHTDTDTSPLATASALSAAITTLSTAISNAQTAINAHTDTDTSPLATASALTAAISTLQTAITSATSALATASSISALSTALELTTTEADLSSAITAAINTLETAITNATTSLALQSTATAIKAQTDQLAFSGSNVKSIVEAVVSGTIATDVWNALLASFDTVNTFGYDVQNITGGGGGGGGGPVTITSTQFAVIQEILSMLGSAQLIHVNSLLNGDTVQLVQSYDYTADTGSPIIVPVTGLPVLSSTAVTLEVAGVVIATGTATLGSGPGIYSIAFNMTHTILAGLTPGTLSARMRAIGPNASNDYVGTLILKVVPA